MPRAIQRDVARGALTEQQERFVQHYVLTGNGRQSAIAAGYAPARAAIEASELIHNPKIKRHLARAKVILEEECEVTPERVVRELALLAFADPSEVIQIKGNTVRITDTAQLSAGARRLIVGVSQSFSKQGHSVRVTLESRPKTIELLARLLGILRPDSAPKLDPGKPLVAVPIIMPAQIEPSEDAP